MDGGDKGVGGNQYVYQIRWTMQLDTLCTSGQAAFIHEGKEGAASNTGHQIRMGHIFIWWQFMLVHRLV